MSWVALAITLAVPLVALLLGLAGRWYFVVVWVVLVAGVSTALLGSLVLPSIPSLILGLFAAWFTRHRRPVSGPLSTEPDKVG